MKLIVALIGLASLVNAWSNVSATAGNYHYMSGILIEIPKKKTHTHN